MLLSFDTETGGLGLDKSLLTLGLIFYDEEKGEKIDEYHWGLIPDNGIYIVDPKGLEVNGIDLVELAKTAITYKEAGTELYNVLKHHSDHGSNKIVPVGKNVHGDINHVCDKLMSRGTWENFVSYRTMDVSSLFQAFRLVGKIPDTVSGSLESICEFYELPTDGLHGALRDAEMTLECLNIMLEEIK